MQDQPDGLLATFRAESEQTKWLLRFGAAGAVFIVMWSWAGSLLLPTLVVGAVNLLAVLTYGAGIAIFVVRIMHASKRWQIEVRVRTNSFQKEQELPAAAEESVAPERTLARERTLYAVGSSAAPASPTPIKSNFHKVHFTLRLQAEVEHARREGSEMGVVWLDVGLPGLDTAEREAENLAADIAKLFAGQAKTIGQPLNIKQNQYVFSLPGQGRGNSRAFVSKLVQALGSYWCNCGIAIYPQDGTSAQELYDEAQQLCEESGLAGSEATNHRRAA